LLASWLEGTCWLASKKVVAIAAEIAVVLMAHVRCPSSRRRLPHEG
jgi:hypothetical protein